ncbi:ABC transporter ATP-binding protein [Ructibacterium gallinarum]|uniref:ABC transporter ATP-binding protein n=1 Tax=Ructibacterium gallinarum TaxID=2779355 RepID=A0A9D5R8J9_9FIRM|nr:ABC transporter ATP-binding protein [Ructibacterium gallinarum]MBE5039519.1 ABC transporter ATP-binding protein [Ructibacterium gallinarum]
MTQNFFKRFLRGAWRNILVLSLLGMGASACGVYLALVSKRVVDTATGQMQGALLQEGLVLAAVIIIQLVLQVCVTTLHVHTSASVKFKMQSYLTERFLKKEKLSADRFHSGELVHRLSGDTLIVAEGIAEIVPAFAAIGARVLLSFVALLMLDSILAVLCVAAGLVTLFAAHLYRKKTGVLFRETRESEGKIRSFLQETVKNLAVIKAFSVYSVIQRQLKKLQTVSYDLTIRKNRVSIGANVCFFTAMTAGYYAALAWGAWRLSCGEITFGTLTAVLGLTGDVTGPFRQLASLFPQYMSVCASSDRLEELEGLHEEELLPEIEPEPFYQKMKAIELRNVRFSYGEGEVLTSISGIFPKGQLTAVTGQSGAGKSTLLNILAGVLKPESGEMLALLEQETVELNSAYRKLFAYVPQEFLLLSGTVVENITLFDENPDMEYVKFCIRVAELEEVVKNLPQGMDTFLGEDGSRLSGGQRQRMAIARALYSRAGVLLLDESTSALSADAEKKILDRLKQCGKTVILVTHRKTAMSLCDHVFVMKGGHIDEQF